jgi:hypothetical protein
MIIIEVINRIYGKIATYTYEDSDYLIVTDKFGRKFKLEPVKNEDIKFPFIISPLP